jgi:hypothetical protein
VNAFDKDKEGVPSGGCFNSLLLNKKLDMLLCRPCYYFVVALF